jgi:hypothetical protein
VGGWGMVVAVAFHGHGADFFRVRLLANNKVGVGGEGGGVTAKLTMASVTGGL